jgi:DNA-binding CsgD family transcriptional regulator
MPYAPITQPLRSVTVIEGQVKTVAQLADMAKRATAQRQSMSTQKATSRALIKECHALAALKFNQNQISQQLGISYESVRYYLKRKVLSPADQLLTLTGVELRTVSQV